MVKGEVVNVKEVAAVMSSLDVSLAQMMLRQQWKEERCYVCTSTQKKRRYLPEIHGPKQWQLVLPWGL